MQDFLVTISLSNLEGERLLWDENPYTGKQELGVFLPLQSANIYKTDKNYCYLSFYASQLSNPTERISHILKPIYNEENFKKRKEMGCPPTRFIGRLRPVSKRKY